MPRVLIVTALPVEFAAARDFLHKGGERGHNRYNMVTYDGFFDARADERWQVRVIRTGSKNEPAAVMTALAADEFQPDYVLFVGVGGSVKNVNTNNSEVALGDIVASDRVYPYTGKLLKRGKQEDVQMRPHALEASSVIQQAVGDSESDDLLNHADSSKSWRALIKEPVELARDPRVFPKPIIATNFVISSRTHPIFLDLLKSYGDAYAVDMEAYGFLSALSPLRMQGLVIRGLSDNISPKTSKGDAYWQAVASRHAAAYAFDIIRRLPFRPARFRDADDPDLGGLGSPVAGPPKMPPQLPADNGPHTDAAESQAKFESQASKARSRPSEVYEEDKASKARFGMQSAFPGIDGYREATWRPAAYVPDRLSRDQILTALQDMIGRWSALGFLKSWGGDRLKSTGNGYEDWAVAEQQDWPFVYWQVMQSGLTYQFSLMPEDVHPIPDIGPYISVRATTVYIASAIEAMVQLYDQLGFNGSEIVSLKITQVLQGRAVRVTADHTIRAGNNLPAVTETLARPLDDWRGSQVELSIQMARAILQRLDLHNPPDDLMKSVIKRNVPPIGFDHAETLL